MSDDSDDNDGDDVKREETYLRYLIRDDNLPNDAMQRTQKKIIDKKIGIASPGIPLNRLNLSPAKPSSFVHISKIKFSCQECSPKAFSPLLSSSPLLSATRSTSSAISKRKREKVVKIQTLPEITKKESKIDKEEDSTIPSNANYELKLPTSLCPPSLEHVESNWILNQKDIRLFSFEWLLFGLNLLEDCSSQDKSLIENNFRIQMEILKKKYTYVKEIFDQVIRMRQKTEGFNSKEDTISTMMNLKFRLSIIKHVAESAIVQGENRIDMQKDHCEWYFSQLSLLLFCIVWHIENAKLPSWTIDPKFYSDDLNAPSKLSAKELIRRFLKLFQQCRDFILPKKEKKIKNIRLEVETNFDFLDIGLRQLEQGDQKLDYPPQITAHFYNTLVTTFYYRQWIDEDYEDDESDSDDEDPSTLHTDWNQMSEILSAFRNVHNDFISTPSGQLSDQLHRSCFLRVLFFILYDLHTEFMISCLKNGDDIWSHVAGTLSTKHFLRRKQNIIEDKYIQCIFNWAYHFLKEWLIDYHSSTVDVEMLVSRMDIFSRLTEIRNNWCSFNECEINDIANDSNIVNKNTQVLSSEAVSEINTIFHKAAKREYNINIRGGTEEEPKMIQNIGRKKSTKSFDHLMAKVKQSRWTVADMAEKNWEDFIKDIERCVRYDVALASRLEDKIPQISKEVPVNLITFMECWCQDVETYLKNNPVYTSSSHQTKKQKDTNTFSDCGLQLVVDEPQTAKGDQELAKTWLTSSRNNDEMTKKFEMSIKHLKKVQITFIKATQEYTTYDELVKNKHLPNLSSLFKPIFDHWIVKNVQRIASMINRCIDQDDWTPVSDQIHHSSSVSDVFDFLVKLCENFYASYSRFAPFTLTISCEFFERINGLILDYGQSISEKCGSEQIPTPSHTPGHAMQAHAKIKEQLTFLSKMTSTTAQQAKEKKEKDTSLEIQRNSENSDVKTIPILCTQLCCVMAAHKKSEELMKNFYEQCARICKQYQRELPDQVKEAMTHMEEQKVKKSSITGTDYALPRVRNRIINLIAFQVIYTNLHECFYVNLYRPHPTKNRIRSGQVMEELNDNMGMLHDLVPGDVFFVLVDKVCRTIMEAFNRIIIERTGGIITSKLSMQAITYAKMKTKECCEIYLDDLEALKEIFLDNVPSESNVSKDSLCEETIEMYSQIVVGTVTRLTV